MKYTRVEIQLEGNKLTYESETNGLYIFQYQFRVYQQPDEITDIFIIKDRIIFQRETEALPGKKEGHLIRNIDAYDWEGNHRWNIGDRSVDGQPLFQSGRLTTAGALIRQGLLDPLDNGEFSSEKDLLICTADDYLLVVDPMEGQPLKRVFRRGDGGSGNSTGR